MKLYKVAPQEIRGILMVVSQDKIRVTVTFDKADYEKIKNIADKDRRPVSNLVAKLALDQLEQIEK